MNLKPFRDIDPHDIINYFSLDVNSGDKGSAVTVASSNPSDYEGWSSDSFSNGIGKTYTVRHEVKSKVKLAPSGSTAEVIGLLLYDVRDTNDWGEKLIFRNKAEQAELQCVTSGQAVPIVTRGLLEVGGYSGTAAPGSGIAVSNAGGGQLLVVGPAVTPNLGKFLSTSGADGYALIKLNVV